MATPKIWSCKLNRPETLKSHRTIAEAINKVGHQGLIYEPEKKAVFQIFELANGLPRLFNTETQADKCNTCGFDMRQAMQNKEFATMCRPFKKKKIFNKGELNLMLLTRKISQYPKNHYYSSLELYRGKELITQKPLFFKSVTGKESWASALSSIENKLEQTMDRMISDEMEAIKDHIDEIKRMELAFRL
jgi:hypothetical protein